MLRKLKLQVKNMEQDPQFVEYATKRLEPLQNLFSSHDGVRWNLRLSKDGHGHKGNVYHAEAQIKTAQKNYGANAHGQTPYEAIDELKNELSKKITTYKDKRTTRLRKGAALLKRMLRGE